MGLNIYHLNEKIGFFFVLSSKLKNKYIRQSEKDFKGRHYPKEIIIQAVTWYLRYALSYRDIEEMFLSQGIEVDHSTVNRWVMKYAPLMGKRLKSMKKLHNGRIRVDETYIRIGKKWHYLYRAIDSQGSPVDFMLSKKRDTKAAKKFFKKSLGNDGLFSANEIGTDCAAALIRAVTDLRGDRLKFKHQKSKHLQQGIESDHYRLKRNMHRNGVFQSLNTARKTISGYEAMLWLRKSMGFVKKWDVCKQDNLINQCFGIQKVNEF